MFKTLTSDRMEMPWEAYEIYQKDPTKSLMTDNFKVTCIFSACNFNEKELITAVSLESLLNISEQLICRKTKQFLKFGKNI